MSDETTNLAARGLAVLARLVPLADDLMVVTARGYVGASVDLQFNAPESVDAFRAAVPAGWVRVDAELDQYRWHAVHDGVQVNAVCADPPAAETILEADHPTTSEDEHGED